MFRKEKTVTGNNKRGVWQANIIGKSPRGGYKIFDIKVFHIVDQGITATKLIVWVHGAFGESWMEGRQV